jgi:hypothetical protein
MSKKILFLLLVSTACLIQAAQKDSKKPINSIDGLKQAMEEVKAKQQKTSIGTSRTKKFDADPEQRKNTQEKK